MTSTSTSTPSPVSVDLCVAPNPGPGPFYVSCFPPDPTAQVMLLTSAHEPVRKIAAPSLDAAHGWAVWDGRDDRGHLVASDVYLVVVRSRSQSKTAWIVVIR